MRKKQIPVIRPQPKKAGAEVKTNCFAYGSKGCSALQELVCEKERCPFYKSKGQHEAELKRTKERLR